MLRAKNKAAHPDTQPHSVRRTNMCNLNAKNSDLEELNIWTTAHLVAHFTHHFNALCM